jgi:hypothetical protein
LSHGAAAAAPLCDRRGQLDGPRKFLYEILQVGLLHIIEYIKPGSRWLLRPGFRSSVTVVTVAARAVPSPGPVSGRPARRAGGSLSHESRLGVPAPGPAQCRGAGASSMALGNSSMKFYSLAREFFVFSSISNLGWLLRFRGWRPYCHRDPLVGGQPGEPGRRQPGCLSSSGLSHESRLGVPAPGPAQCQWAGPTAPAPVTVSAA